MPIDMVIVGNVCPAPTAPLCSAVHLDAKGKQGRFALSPCSADVIEQWSLLVRWSLENLTAAVQ